MTQMYYKTLGDINLIANTSICLICVVGYDSRNKHTIKNVKYTLRNNRSKSHPIWLIFSMDVPGSNPKLELEYIKRAE